MSAGSVATTSRRPPKEERDRIRRDQIVAAARQCVVRYGFHAASMAEISAAAKMSVGQIYRYFSNKEAIIHAIVEQIVALRLQGIVDNFADRDLVEDLARKVLEGVHEHREDQILMLEITAEATRNPEVADIVKRADQRLKERAVEAIRSDRPGLERQEALLRVEMLAVLFEGTAFRTLGGVGSEPGSLRHYRSVIECVLAGPH